METKVVELDLNDVLPNRFQPRIKFSEESIEALADSIKEHGVIQPIVVRNIGDKYEIIAGERRYKASVLAGKKTIPAIITNLSEKDSAEVALIENVQRKDLTPIEEAISYKKILDMGYLTQDVLAIKLGKTQSTVANKLRLLNLDDDVQDALLNEKISERHARSLLRISSHEKQRKMLSRIISERLTVRKTDEEIDKMMNDNVEVLDFGQSLPTEEEQPNIQNIEDRQVVNSFFEQLNIPTEPIIEDSIPELFPSVQESFNSVPFNPTSEIINSTIPPVSFSTIDNLENPLEELNTSSIFSVVNNHRETNNQSNIEQENNNLSDIPENNNIEVADIFVEKTIAPIDELLQPSKEYTSPMSEQISNENNETDEDESAETFLTPGKFFNLMPEEDEVPANEEFQNDSFVDAFNFDFDINSLNNVELTNNLSFSEDNHLEDVELSNLPETESPTTTPLFNSESFEKPTNSNENTEYTPINKNVNSSNNMFQEEPTFNINLEQSIPEFNPASASETSIVPNNTPELRDAINMIRDFSKKLNEMGFIVDVEEFDFENMYQLVFKINK